MTKSLNIWMNEGVAAKAVMLVAVCGFVNLNLITNHKYCILFDK